MPRRTPGAGANTYERRISPVPGKGVTSEQGLEFIAVSANHPDERDQVAEFLKKHSADGPNFLFALEDTGLMMRALDSGWKKVLPCTVMIDKGNRLVHRKEGRVDPVELSHVIERELSR